MRLQLQNREHNFQTIPSIKHPRARFDRSFQHKTTFNSGYLVPVFVDEVLPGDTFKCSMTGFARLATPLKPVMDNMYLSTFFFFVPARLLWSHWVNFNGEQVNPGDSISYVIPQVVSPSSGGFVNGTLPDYFGLPTAVNNLSVNALPFRAYNLIFNTWFRDENLTPSLTVQVDDGPDTYANYSLQRRAKAPGYFTSALPWPQKGSTPVSLPLGTSAPVYGTGYALGFSNNSQGFGLVNNTSDGYVRGYTNMFGTTVGTGSPSGLVGTNVSVGVVTSGQSGLYADLSHATAATINSIRQAFQYQRLLERDARGGTRYTEIVRSHFGVISPDARLQRPEYLGGGRSKVIVSPIAQTSATGITGGSAPQGNLTAIGTLAAHGHGFVSSFTEHGYILGLACIDADITYQQGLHKMWSRSTRYDFYLPVLAMLGEQAIANREIYCDGSANDALTFGYIPRWDEYRMKPSIITGQFRSNFTTPLDSWHLSQYFTSLPVLGDTFIRSTPPVQRVVAVQNPYPEWIFDSIFQLYCTRPMPVFSVPGMIDHF